MKIRLVVDGYVTNDTHCGNKLLGFESVPKRNFVSSLQGYGNSLEQVLCFQGSRVTCVILLPKSARSSAASLFHSPPVLMAIGTKWCVAVRQAYFLDFFYCCLCCCCACVLRCFCNVGLSVGIRNGDVPCKQFAACPRDERRAVRPLSISSR